VSDIAAPAIPMLPAEARIVVGGGGIAGCSTAYHLARLGEENALLLEQGRLTCGTTWHAAGLVGQMRPNRNMTRMSKYGIELYATLEAETGLATSWKTCGSVKRRAYARAHAGPAPAAGAGLHDAGCYALDALRLESGRRAWGAELGPDETPIDAGTMFAVDLDKAGGFIGREALHRAAAAVPHKRLVTVVLEAADAWAWGGEPLAIAGEAAGELTSAGFSLRAGRSVGLGYLRGAAAARRHEGSAVGIVLWGETVAATAWDRWPADL
jgi:glycine/D-amino acid oxidase-like deaminating enzyme